MRNEVNCMQTQRLFLPTREPPYFVSIKRANNSSKTGTVPAMKSSFKISLRLGLTIWPTARLYFPLNPSTHPHSFSRSAAFLYRIRRSIRRGKTTMLCRPHWAT